MNLWMVFLIFALLVAGDKIITIANIHQVNKNFNLKDKYEIEKNPVAKWFFEKLGLFGGSLVYYPLSILTVFVAFLLLRIPFGSKIALYILVLLYGLVLANNFYFLFKYSRLIP